MILRQHNQFLLSRPPAAEPPLVLLELVENEEGGQISIHGLLAHVWAAGDEGYRRYAAVNLMPLRIAPARVISTGSGISTATLWPWKSAGNTAGITGLISEKVVRKETQDLMANSSA